ncbi:hypothetical protein IAR55_003202 [Kwoniella newhampshirensis]|uniref:Transcription factor domain-containing protein n=1 Tax=Kwoniella newhampshirensis TaxID=1651941 RepID=A0AAW0Z1I4_9TREE
MLRDADLAASGSSPSASHLISLLNPHPQGVAQANFLFESSFLEYLSDADMQWSVGPVASEGTQTESIQQLIARVTRQPSSRSYALSVRSTSPSPAPAHLSSLSLPTGLAKQPDPLIAYFPSTEQRHLFRHFLNETAPALVVIPIPQDRNPWLVHTIRLALGQPYGQDVFHDAFRTALISLASLDVGMKSSTSLQQPSDNAMYELSYDQRSTALELLNIGEAMNGGNAGLDAVDLTLAAVVALAFRDRLAGCQSWEEPITLGVKSVSAQGGPAAYIARHSTLQTRFLIEQMACVELLGCMTNYVAPKIFSWDNPWLHRRISGEDLLQGSEEGDSTDHLALVYGWDRLALQCCARSMVLNDEYQQVGLLKERNSRYGYAAVTSMTYQREVSMLARGKKLVEEAQALRSQPTPSSTSVRVSRGNSSLLICLEVTILCSHLRQDLNHKDIQTKVEMVLDILDKSMGEGMFAGFLLPLVWIAVCADLDHKERVNSLFSRLQQHYHLEPALMNRLVEFQWGELATASLEIWLDEMRKTKTYVPIF